MQVLCSNGVKQLVRGLLPGSGVEARYFPTTGILRELDQGAHADVLIVAVDAIEGLARGGRVDASTRVDIARSGVGVAVKSGAPRPDISSESALREALLAARAVGYSKAGASGPHALAALDKLGVGDKVRLVGIVGRFVGDALVDEEIDLGLQQISELVPIAGIDVLGPVPASLQTYTTFSAVIATAATDRSAARALIQRFVSEEARSRLARLGLEPA